MTQLGFEANEKCLAWESKIEPRPFAAAGNLDIAEGNPEIATILGVTGALNLKFTARAD